MSRDRTQGNAARGELDLVDGSHRALEQTEDVEKGIAGEEIVEARQASLQGAVRRKTTLGSSSRKLQAVGEIECVLADDQRPCFRSKLLQMMPRGQKSSSGDRLVKSVMNPDSSCQGCPDHTQQEAQCENYVVK